MNDTINRFLAILCYPYASLDFFQEDYFAEIINNEQMGKGIEEIKDRLKDKLVQYMQRNYSIYSYDEIYLYLDKCYLYDLQINKNMGIESLYYDHLMKIVKALISQRDGKVVFKYWESRQSEKFFGGFGAKNKIFLFYSMNMHMPMDFLVMLYAVQNIENGISCLNNYFGQIEIADQQLDAILKKGVAENHLHNGVSLPFPEIWEELMLPVKGEDKQYYESLRYKLSDGTREAAELFFLIFSAAVIRIYLALSVKGQYLIEDRGSAEDELQR